MLRGDEYVVASYQTDIFVALRLESRPPLPDDLIDTNHMFESL